MTEDTTLQYFQFRNQAAEMPSSSAACNKGILCSTPVPRIKTQKLHTLNKN
jgi:hypothetical protein